MPLLIHSRHTKGSSTYDLLKNQLLMSAKKETDNHMFFVDSFMNRLGLCILVRGSWSLVWQEMNITSVLPKTPERNASSGCGTAAAVVGPVKVNFYTHTTKMLQLPLQISLAC